MATKKPSKPETKVFSEEASVYPTGYSVSVDGWKPWKITLCEENGLQCDGSLMAEDLPCDPVERQAVLRGFARAITLLADEIETD
jgi:hypothetical protein